MAPLLVTVPEAAKLLRLSPAMIYVLLSRGEIKGVHIGRALRISLEALQTFVGGLEET